MSDNELGLVLPFSREKDVTQLRLKAERLKHGDGGGTSGGMTDDWKDSVERRLGELHGDIRSLLRWGIAAVVALAVMVAGLYLYTNAKFEALNQRMTDMGIQQAKSDATVNGKLELLIDRLPRKKVD